MNIAQIGNASAPFSTENEINKALLHLGHNVAFFDESEHQAFNFDPVEYQAVIWTHTTGFNKYNPIWHQREMLRKARKANVPTVQFHLDRFWGLQREHLVHEEPMFDCDLVCTADGGHQEDWQKIGVNHHWFPPAVSEFECETGEYNSEYASDIAFIGGWQNYGHPEAKHRFALIQWLQENYAGRVRFWPQPGQPAIREQKLRDVIASTKVIVGDSCIVDWENERAYWSDRIPETLGRGGFLLHPYVHELQNHYHAISAPEYPGWPSDMDMWEAWKWDELKAGIDVALAEHEHTAKVKERGRKHVLETATYTVRMEQLFELMQKEGIL